MHATPNTTTSSRKRNLARGAIATALGGAITLTAVAPAMAATPGEQLDAAIAGVQAQVDTATSQVNEVTSALQAGDVAGAADSASQAVNSYIPPAPAAPALPEIKAPALPEIKAPAAASSAPALPNIEVPPVDIAGQLGTGNPVVDDTLRQIESAINRTIGQVTSPTDEGINRPINIPGVGVIKRDPASGDFYLWPESGYMGPKDLAFGFIGPDGEGHLGWITIRTPGGGTAGVGAGNGGVDLGVQGSNEGRSIHVTRDGAQVVDRGPAVREGQASNNLTVNPTNTPTSDPTTGADPYNPQNPTSPYNPDNPTSPYNPSNPDSPLYGDPEDRDAATREADAIAAQQARESAANGGGEGNGEGTDDEVEPTELPGLRDVSDEDGDGAEETERVSLPGLRDADDSTLTLAEQSRELAERALRGGADELPGLSSTTEPTPTTSPDADEDASDPTDPTSNPSTGTPSPKEDTDTSVDAQGEDEGMSTGAKVGIGAGILAALAAAGAAVGLRRKPEGTNATSVTADSSGE